MKVGIIGFGNMGKAIAERLKNNYRIFVFDKDSSKTRGLSGINVANNLTELINKVDALILAVKPQDFDSLLKEIKNYAKEKLIISIAAGIETGYIEKSLGKVRVIRAMPNIGLKIGESVTCLSKGALASEVDLTSAKELFSYLGVTKEIEESLMNAATAISGSGPGYIFYFIETESIEPSNIPEQVRCDIIKRLQSAAESVGFNADDANFLATHTTSSSINLLQITKLAPKELRTQVASKAGTTEAALKVLNNGGSWTEAAQAALRRAEELSKIA